MTSRGYKQTDVGLIPNDWEILPLKNVSSMHGRIGWQGLKQAEFTMNPEDPFLITGMNFKDGEIRWEDVYHIPQKRYEEAKEIQLDTGDVLMTKDGTIGKVLYIDKIPYPYKASLNSHLLVFRPLNNRYIPKFLFYQLASKIFHNYIEQEKSGTTFFGITQEAVGKYRMLLPPPCEQQAIAAALSDVDAEIAALDELIAKKRDIKQGAMQELLTGKTRLPGFSGEWEVRHLGEIAEIISGGTPKTTVAGYWNGSVKWCTPTDITRTKGKYLTGTERTISHDGLRNSSAQLLPIGALLLCSRATIGDIKIASIEVCTNQGFKSLICNENAINEYLYYLILTIKQKIMEKAIGSTFLEISKKDVASLELLLPDIPEQEAITAILSDMDAEIAALEEKREKTQALKQGMMQELLTGKTRLI